MKQCTVNKVCGRPRKPAVWWFWVEDGRPRWMLYSNENEKPHPTAARCCRACMEAIEKGAR